MKTRILMLALLIQASLFSINTYAINFSDGHGDHTGVSGKVIDKNTGESLAGAVILLKGTDIKTYTDLEGNFSIDNLQPGTYDLEISYISYQNTEVTHITTTAGQSTSLEIAIISE